MRWEKFRIIVNSDSGVVNTDSGKTGKVFTLKPVWVFTFDRNGCSRWARMGVHDAPEYAPFCLVMK